jgi:biotin carboxyl carrier protein
MYGRRRRPLLGAAVVLGVSSATAKREVAANNQRELAARQAEDLRRAEIERQQSEARHAADRATWEKERAENAGKGQSGNVKSEGPGNVKVDPDGNTRFCSKCGSKYNVGSNFCVGCGVRLND